MQDTKQILLPTMARVTNWQTLDTFLYGHNFFLPQSIINIFLIKKKKRFINVCQFASLKINLIKNNFELQLINDLNNIMQINCSITSFQTCNFSI